MSQCKEMVYVRDTYRYTGRGSSGFELHYTRRDCKRPATVDGYCWQHARLAAAREQSVQTAREEFERFYPGALAVYDAEVTA